MKKILTLVACLSLVASLAIGGSIAYLTATDTEANTFTIGNVSIDIDENGFTNGAQLKPGIAVDKKADIKNTGKNSAYVWMSVAVEPSEAQNYIDLTFDDSNAWSVRENTAMYNSILTPSGETSVPGLVSVTLSPSVDIINGTLTAVENGVSTPICSIEDLKVIVNAYAIQSEGFASVAAAYDAYNAQWGENSGASSTPSVVIPDDAVAVSTLAELENAFAVGGNYKITAPFTVEGILNVSASTNLYNDDPQNVLTFAQNARIKTAENVDLALYGVEINGGGSFTMEDGNFSINTAVNNDAILMAFAGSTLTLGQGTNIQHVVSTAPAVAWAKGTEDNRATIILKGATIQNCAGGSGTAINVDNYGDVYIEEGTVISDNVSYNDQNHGIIRIYNPWDTSKPSTLTMNGGEIKNNHFSGSGLIGLYYGKMTMNGGKMSNNSWFSYNKNNLFYCCVYVHSNSQFIMNDGEICDNIITDGVINAINTEIEGAVTFNGGTVTNNTNTRNDNKDALVAVCYPDAVCTTDGTEKILVISDNANVTGTVYNHADLNDQVVRNYIDVSEFRAQ